MPDPERPGAPHFPVPDAYRQLDLSPERQSWIETMPSTASRLAATWEVEPDGEPMSGFLSVVWPVRHASGRRLVLKIHDFFPGTEGEGVALAAARGPGLVELLQWAGASNALLLERLDPLTTLVSAEEDAATETIGDLIAEITAHPAPSGLRSLADEADRAHTSITANLDRTPSVLPRTTAERALETLTDLAASVRADVGRLCVLHGDLHYDNVLHTLPDEPPRWVAIDPLPLAGYPEWELAPAMRNRWEDAAATGDPDRALRRRFDLLCERAGLSGDVALEMLRAIAVDNVLWLAGDDQAHPIRQQHLLAYSVIATWA